jgi:hypothetical protein
MRAMVLPAGKHKLEWRFEPVVYAVGERISLGSSLVLLLLLLGLGVREVVKIVRKD